MNLDAHLGTTRVPEGGNAARRGRRQSIVAAHVIAKQPVSSTPRRRPDTPPPSATLFTARPPVRCIKGHVARDRRR